MFRSIIYYLVLLGMTVFLYSCDSSKTIYTVSFDSQDGTAFVDQHVSRGSTIELPTPEKEGYMFNEWRYNGTSFKGDQKVTSDLHLEAVYEKITEVFTYDIMGNEVVILSYNGTISDLIIPNKIEGRLVTHIGFKAFEESSIVTIKIPNSVRSIAAQAFLETDSLEHVSFYGEFMGQVEDRSMPSHTYYQLIEQHHDVCIKSPHPNFPVDEVLNRSETVVTHGGEFYSYHVVYDLMYYYTLTSAQQISTSAFLNSGVREIELSERFRMCIDCFNGAYALETIIVSDQNPYYTTSDSVLYSKDMTELIVYPQGKTQDSFTIPDSVKSVYPIAFNENPNLINIHIPKGSQLYGNTTDDNFNQFTRLESLKSFTVDENHSLYSSVDGVLYDKEKTVLIAYPPGSSSTSFVVPTGVLEISFGAFSNANNLINIEIAETVRKIGPGAFYYTNPQLDLIILGNDLQVNGMGGLFRQHGDPFAPGNFTIYVQDDYVLSYQSMHGWSQYADRIKPLSERP